MRDPYTILGIAKTATQDEIKKAYRKLARALHPDVNPGDKLAEEQFKEASAAYDLLSDENKRARYDRGEINADGTERGRARTGRGPFGGGFGSSGFGGGGFGSRGGARNWDFENTFSDEDLFSDLFKNASRGPGGRHHTSPQKGADARYRLHVSFEEAALGCTKTVSLANGRKVSVKIPPGSDDESVLRLKGMGNPGTFGGVDGDALVEVTVKPHAVFRREGHTVVAEIPVSLAEAVLGAKITVPTVDGKVQVTVPEGSNTGTTLRLRGKGIPKDITETAHRGDQLCKLRVVIENPDDAKLKSFLKKWSPETQNPRAKLGLE